jgi:hypothetical protein
MSPTGLRLIGVVFLIAAVVFALLNLKRFLALGMPWLAPLLMVFGAAFMTLSRRAQQ